MLSGHGGSRNSGYPRRRWAPPAVYHLSPGVGTSPAHPFPGESLARPGGGGQGHGVHVRACVCTCVCVCVCQSRRENCGHFLGRCWPRVSPAHRAAPSPQQAGRSTGRSAGPGTQRVSHVGQRAPPGPWGQGSGPRVPGADDVLVQAALTALALGPEAREALLQGVQVGHLGTRGQKGGPAPPSPPSPRGPHNPPASPLTSF